MKHPHNKKSSLEGILAKLVVGKMEEKEIDFYKPILSYIQKRHKPVYHRFAIWILTWYRDDLQVMGLCTSERYAAIGDVISAHRKCASGKTVYSKVFASARRRCGNFINNCEASKASIANISHGVSVVLSIDMQMSNLSKIIQEQLHRGNEYR